MQRSSLATSCQDSPLLESGRGRRSKKWGTLKDKYLEEEKKEKISGSRGENFEEEKEEKDVGSPGGQGVENIGWESFEEENDLKAEKIILRRKGSSKK